MPGQAYVALSRVRNLNGLYLLGFDATTIRVNPTVVREMDRLRQQAATVSTSIGLTPAHGQLKIILLNIRSYLEHEEDLKTDGTLHEVDVFCFIEPFLNQQQQVVSILPESKIIRADRPAALGRGGGVMTIASKEMVPQELKLNISGLEYIAVGVKTSSTMIHIITIYRPPSIALAEFITKLQMLLRSLPSNVPTVILGNFNIDLIDSLQHQMLTVMQQFGFNQKVTGPTTDHGTTTTALFQTMIQSASLWKYVAVVCTYVGVCC